MVFMHYGILCGICTPDMYFTDACRRTSDGAAVVVMSTYFIFIYINYYII